ncbi:nucleotidyltransferase family protein [Mangrovibacterium marinum]|uniref:nucleotidyltransferase family protein n=1 Tax=Mangrovibacterium marinum TaxID=1639118 RepID=UPI002A189C84|nr:nucleotidyltransferase family protein [Mangrovibacterium marinum]
MSKISEALILAGGLGTRLRSVSEGNPKALVGIVGKPFLEYLLDYLIHCGIERFVFSVGYKAANVQAHFGKSYSGKPIEYAVEAKPLGTGGAIVNSLSFTTSDHVLVVNGDSIFLTDIQQQFREHLRRKADVTLALKKMQSFDRYGSVVVADDQRIVAFKEKEFTEEGLINGGVYVVDVAKFKVNDFPEKFSIENDYFQKKVLERKFYGVESDGYFIDIGVPDDFRKAQHEFKRFTNR